MKVPTKVVVVTGPTNCGKTSVVEAIVSKLIGQGCGVSGFIQPGLWQNKEKIGFRVRDVRTGEEIDLARRVEAREGQHGTGFVFETDGFDLAARALARRQVDDVLIVDELGPLELRGRGHMPAVRRAIGDGSLRAVMLVVRRHLVPSLLLSLEAEDATVVDVTGSEGESPSSVLRAVGVDCASSYPGKRSGRPSSAS
jgi:nucleoside-triphosphatase THEP1